MCTVEDLTLQKWVNVIESDECDKAKELLDTVEFPTKLIHGKIKMPPRKLHVGSDNSMLDILTATNVDGCPWWLIVARCASVHLIPLFLKYDVDVFVQDEDGNNFVHTLVVMAALNSSQEENCAEAFKTLMMHTHTDSRLKLLHQENKQGLRPLELAAKLGCWTILEEIYSVDNIYLKNRKNLVPLTLQHHSITEYTFVSRMFKSPLFYSLNMSKESAVNLTKCTSLLMFLNTWAQAHIKNVNPFIILLFIFKLVFSSLYIWFDTYVAAVTDINTCGSHTVNVSQATNDTCLRKSKSWIVDTMNNSAFRWVLITILVSATLLDLLSTCVLCVIHSVGAYHQFSQGQNRGQLHKTKGNFITFRIFIFFNCFASVGVTVAVIIDLLMYFSVIRPLPIEQDVIFYFVLVSYSFVLASFSVFMKPLGYNFLVIQEMFSQTAGFLCLFAMISVPFVSATERLFYRGCSDCLLNFNQVIGIIYILALNLVGPYSPQEIMSLDADKRMAVQLVHTVFIFVVPVILINFLIALYSFKASEVMATKETRLLLARLRVSKLYVFCKHYLCKSKTVRQAHHQENKIIFIHF